MTEQTTTQTNTLKWVSATLLNDEVSTDKELIYYFIENGLSNEEAVYYVNQRDKAILNELNFKLEVYKE